MDRLRESDACWDGVEGDVDAGAYDGDWAGSWRLGLESMLTSMVVSFLCSRGFVYLWL